MNSNWQAVDGEVRHTFTHFHLILTVMAADVTADTNGYFLGPKDFRPSDLPTVMRKAFDLVRP